MSNQSAWGAPIQQPTNSVSRAATVLVVATDLADNITNALRSHANLTVLAVAATPDEVRERLVTLSPDVVVADGLVFQGASEVIAVLGSFPGACMILLPRTRTPDDERPLLVKGWLVGDREAAHAPDTYAPLLSRLADHRLAQTAAPDFSTPVPRPAGATRWAAVAVLGGQGQSGRSAIAAALAHAAAHMGVRTLAVGLGTPDALAFVFRGRSEPNLMDWAMDPSPTGLERAVQHVQDNLDILAGPPSPLALVSYAERSPEDAAALPALMRAAMTLGYMAIVLDVSVTPQQRPDLVRQVLAASSKAILVALPTTLGVLAASQVMDLADQVGFTGAMHLVVNQTRDPGMTAEQLIRAGSHLRREFAPLLADIPYDKNLVEAMERRESPFLFSRPLQDAAKKMAHTFFGAMVSEEEAPPKTGRVISLGPLGRIRIS